MEESQYFKVTKLALRIVYDFIYPTISLFQRKYHSFCLYQKLVNGTRDIP